MLAERNFQQQKRHVADKKRVSHFFVLRACWLQKFVGQCKQCLKGVNKNVLANVFFCVGDMLAAKIYKSDLSVTELASVNIA